jgi:hypothetical protein
MLTEDLSNNLTELGYSLHSRDEITPLLIYGVSWAIPEIVTEKRESLINDLNSLSEGV